MKRIFFIALIFLNVNTFAQKYPIYQNLGSPNTAIENNGGMIIKGTLVPPRFTDTSAANVAPYTKFYPGNQINTTSDNLYWYRSSDTTKWIQMGNGGSGGSGIDSAAYHTTTQINDTTIKQTKPNGDGTVWQFISSGTGSGQVPSDWDATSGVAQILHKPIITNAVTNGIIDPLLVTWSDQGLIFDISAGSFIYNNVVHNVSETKDTLSAADVTYPRIDAFYVDTLGNIGHITGVAQANPVAPQVTYGQFLLTTVYLNANSTTPPNVNLTTIYDENTEWTTSSSGTGVIDFNNTVNPYHLTKAIKVTSQSAGFAMIFTNPSGIDTAGIGDVLKFFIYTATNLSNGYTFQFYSGSNAVSTPLVITQPGYGYNPFLTGTYQNVSIPLSAFTFYSPYYNAIKITANGSNGNPVYWDYIQIQRGVYQFAPTDYSNKLDSVTNVGGNLYQWAKGSSKYITALGGAGSGGISQLGSPTFGLDRVNDSTYVADTVNDLTSKLRGDSLMSAISTKQDNIALTTTGTSGAATLTGSTLNIPNYASDLWQKNGTKIYYNSGNVGIGTDTPSVKLTIKNDSIGETTSSSMNIAGLMLTNNAIATSSLSQDAPTLNLRSSGWDQATNTPISSVLRLRSNAGYNLIAPGNTFYPNLNIEGSNDGGNTFSPLVTFTSRGGQSSMSIYNINTTFLTASNSISTATNAGSSTSTIVNRAAIGNQMIVGNGTGSIAVDSFASVRLDAHNIGFLPNRLTQLQRDSMAYYVTSTTIVNGGTGYTTAPTVSFSNSVYPIYSGGTPSATGTATISGGSVTGITITNGGYYNSTPSISITGGGGSGAIATAHISQLTLPAGLTIYCTNCTATDGSTGVMQTYNGTTWKNNW